MLHTSLCSSRMHTARSVQCALKFRFFTRALLLPTFKIVQALCAVRVHEMVFLSDLRLVCIRVSSALIACNVLLLMHLYCPLPIFVESVFLYHISCNTHCYAIIYYCTIFWLETSSMPALLPHKSPSQYPFEQFSFGQWLGHIRVRFGLNTLTHDVSSCIWQNYHVSMLWRNGIV